jgi:hypothetical protein
VPLPFVVKPLQAFCAIHYMIFTTPSIATGIVSEITSQFKTNLYAKP